MERRDFFKRVIITPFLTPLLLAAKKRKNDCELHLITDDIELNLPLILKELHDYAPSSGHSFALLNSHPRADVLKQALAKNGLMFVQKATQAGMTLSFSQLRQKTLPSFTLIKEGRIWDIRSRKLYSLWREMNKRERPSSLLTIVSFKNMPPHPFHGEYVSVFRNGRKVEMIPLGENATKSYRAKDGKITLEVRNRKAWVSESTCRHKICLNSPPVYMAGQRIICAPNHFLLEIKGNPLIDTSIG